MSDGSVPLTAQCQYCKADIASSCLVGMVPVTLVEPGADGEVQFIVRTLPMILGPLKCPLCGEYLVKQQEASRVLRPASANSPIVRP